MISKSVLKEYRDIKREGKDLDRRIKQLQKQLNELENMTVIDTVSGGYGGTQHFKIEGIPDEIYSKKKTMLLSQKYRHERNLSRVLEIEDEVWNFIDNISSSRDRLVYRYYYADGMTQQQKAMKVHVDQKTVSNILNKYFS